MTRLLKKEPWVIVNDIFDELSVENRRLLNELNFANKCLTILIRFKDFVDSVFEKTKPNFDSNDSTNYEEMIKEVEEVLSERPEESNEEENCHEFVDDFNSDTTDDNSCLISQYDQKGKRRTSEKSIFCTVDDCQYKTHLKRNLMNHLNAHKDGIKPFRCVYNSCSKSFLAEQSLKCHIRTVHKFRDKYEDSANNKHIGKYRCDFIGCHYETKFKKMFINHMNNHNGIKPFICDFISCGKSFVSEDGLKCHNEYVHKNVGRFKCDLDGCNYQTYNSNRLTNHMNGHRGVRPFECHYCQSRFVCKTYLRDHIRVIHESRPNAFKCDFDGCFKSFKDNKYLKQHYRNVHFNQKRVRQRVLDCDIPGCKYKADCEAVLKIHKASHSEERPYKCSFEGCHKSFKVKGSLKAHTEEYHLGKTFKCDAIGCGLTFTNRTTLRNHFDGQHSDKVLSCDWPGCDYTSKLERNLKKHKLVHKTVSDYPCDWPECNKSFKSRAYLVQHLRIHNNDKRYACSWPGCQYRCAHSGNIHKHKKIHEKKCL